MIYKNIFNKNNNNRGLINYELVKTSLFVLILFYKSLIFLLL